MQKIKAANLLVSYYTEIIFTSTSLIIKVDTSALCITEGLHGYIVQVIILSIHLALHYLPTAILHQVEHRQVQLTVHDQTPTNLVAVAEVEFMLKGIIGKTERM